MANWNSNNQQKVIIPEQKVNYIRPKNYFRSESTICNVKFKERSGTGAIYGYEFPKGMWRTLFITSYHLLGISDLREITCLRLNFKDEIIRNLDITPDWVKWLWTSPRYKFNVTVIEFSPIALKILSRTKYARLVSATPEADTQVTIYDFNGTATGTITNVSEDNIYFNVKVDEEVNTGVPLLNGNLDVVGIHVDSWTSSNEQETRRAINIRSLFKAYSNYIISAFGGKSENEQWLEKINAIPVDKFQHIGSGGFGNVFKINSQTDLAVKIVKGVGKMDDYKVQVRALKKEYGIVTSLDNHPRIIQFFGFVTDDINIRLMIIMEYLEGGSLEDKLRSREPLPKFFAHKYLLQILEGIDFLHERNIFHSDIKPANVLLTAQNNIKICDFGIAVGTEWQTEASATSSHIKGDFHYMSPERINNSSRSATNDIWSIGATYVQMATGLPLNHEDSFMQFIMNISQYKIFINGKAIGEFLQTVNDDEFTKLIITKTLCIESKRSNCRELLSIVEESFSRTIYQFKLHRRIPKQMLINPSENNPVVYGMSYNAAGEELFLADFENKLVRTIRVRDKPSDLRDVYRVPFGYVYSVCHIIGWDALLVCSHEQNKFWLVALSRSGSDWREVHRVETEAKGPMISCALSDSRVLIGEYDSNYLELFCVDSGPRVKLFHCITLSEEYLWFSATCGSDTLVAMSYEHENEVRVHRLCGDKLEELARTQLENSRYLLWLNEKLLATEWNRDTKSHAVIEFEVRGTRLDRRQLIAFDDKIEVWSWCTMEDGVAIFRSNSKEILQYKFV